MRNINIKINNNLNLESKLTLDNEMLYAHTKFLNKIN